ncbi:endonuclease domain-containing protein [Adlercreutzia faecimuris]|uniref:Endonuclease domain-containing protein n=1 Tax=Adlercreutzia faecimuris TaxID=2897341 RepID=A0ABS9WDH7_9ACTN|nr:endonuclease domain-containing protein [Adlercreutzia sp. JBNU-10]MCI2240910.1 endonuclease domain-containing protein [Adlercreutzia sp. JBNU-10]
MTKNRRQVLAERAQRMRREMTRQERKLWYQFLKTYEFSFVTQKVMGNYILDFYCKKLHLSIELDGSQHFEPRALRYDQIRTTFLETEGIKELRFTNRDIDESFEGVCEIIHQEAQKRRPDARQFQFDFMRLLEKS